MTPKGILRKEGEETVKTTIDLPQDLWRAAKIRAMDERADLRVIVIRALAAYLKTKSKGGGAS
jgi:hypothetical protein